jgi:hypothetical protein
MRIITQKLTEGDRFIKTGKFLEQGIGNQSGETHLTNKSNLISIITKIFALMTLSNNLLVHHYHSEKINQTINWYLLVYTLNRYFVNKIRYVFSGEPVSSQPVQQTLIKLLKHICTFLDL